MSRALVWLLAASMALAVGCGGENKKKPKAKRAEGEASEGMYGVDPSVFKCEPVVPLDAMAQAVGGEVRAMESMFKPPTGTPAPCDFRQLHVEVVEVPDGSPYPAQRMWSVRFDCRESYMKSTRAEMERRLAEEGATKVDVGKLGVDHRDAALVFLDDDAPCSVTVVGPGAEERAGIARIVESKLTMKTAPMTPRPATRLKTE